VRIKRRGFIIGTVVLVGLLSTVKPAVIQLDQHTRLLMLWRWQSGAIRFVNSVTDRPIRIDFRIGGEFEGFSVTTDELTEEYYTAGVYSMNDELSHEATDTLRFCSMKGLTVRLGFYEFDLKDQCLEVKLLWTI
jgi:hypothetical protein